MSDFHHLNLSYRIERQNAGKSYIWNFTVYNVYNRLNPWYYYKKGERMKQITLFPISNFISGVSAEGELNVTKKSKTI